MPHNGHCVTLTSKVKVTMANNVNYLCIMLPSDCIVSEPTVKTNKTKTEINQSGNAFTITLHIDLPTVKNLFIDKYLINWRHHKDNTCNLGV